jgi:hypothetical protein
MTDLAKHYGSATGPLGFPMQDRQAFALDAVLKQLPQEPAYAYRRLALEKATTELMPGERSDVSWITTEDVDRDREVVLAKGMNDSHFALNPVVTLNHSYWAPPVGRSLWRKRVKDGERQGVKAKTVYPPRPAGWPADQEWRPDTTLSLIQSGLLNGKSIGFLPLKSREPTDRERESRPGWARVQRVIEEWLLLEYACCYFPCQQNALVEDVAKGLPDDFLKALGVAIKSSPTPGRPEGIPFTTVDEIARCVGRVLGGLDFTGLVRRAVEAGLDRRRGRI